MIYSSLQYIPYTATWFGNGNYENNSNNPYYATSGTFWKAICHKTICYKNSRPSVHHAILSVTSTAWRFKIKKTRHAVEVGSQ